VAPSVQWWPLASPLRATQRRVRYMQAQDRAKLMPPADPNDGLLVQVACYSLLRFFASTFGPTSDRSMDP
jgi:hypothetical protein